ncbi:TetR/AcrR family transcriptional regulator [Methylobrevis albus]|uniref:TetR family transcriptional regulator n=1 Tax=Methylobrevis albus TaxID=2793297 RepID=A0A931MY63_9HYPH|nr:TetR/AcrR family transcriptional regulator [Methylobrevis albus]MBH0240038.1 TetR family transcriptional regulator [Methylobrevis albus]
MSTAHTRPKQPELVRRALLDCAARLAAEQGLAGLTVQAVADAAGVTKGGFFHHFPSKQALIDAVFADLVAHFDGEVEALMAADPEPFGRFTRAYVEATFRERLLGRAAPSTIMSLSMLADPELRLVWSRWFEGRMAQHAETDASPVLEIARLAADGLCLNGLLSLDSTVIADIEALRAELAALTRPR